MNCTDILSGEKLVPVLVIENAEDALPLAKAIYDGGISVLEITFRTPCAAEAIRIVREKLPAVTVGAGTVLTDSQLAEAVAAGAQFIVSPGFNPSIVKRATELGIPVIPGVSSPTELEAAMSAGLRLLKFFPAEESGGAKYLKALASPYSGVMFMPTGGINMKNIGEYLSLPNVTACGGSFIADKNSIKTKNWALITEKTAAAVAALTKSDEKAPTHKPLSPRQGKIVTFGEIMLRLSSADSERLLMNNRLEAVFGGAEANTAVLLSNLGARAAYVTRLPYGPVGDGAVNSLRKYGVDVSGISRGGSRVGIYFLEKGAGVRPSRVIYDRAGSAISEAKPEDFDFEEIFRDASVLHLTGITPALSENAARLTKYVCKRAAEKGVFVSLDINYRSGLWSCQKASGVLSEILPYTDMCIINEEHAELLFGIKGSKPENDGIEPDYYRFLCRGMSDKFGIDRVAMTVRRTHSDIENTVCGALYEKENDTFVFSPVYRINVAEKIGGGDAFSAGLIYSLCRGDNALKSVTFAVGCCALKHSVAGDYGVFTEEEVNDFLSGKRNGVKR